MAGSEQPSRVPEGGWQVEEVFRRGWRELEKALRFPFPVLIRVPPRLGSYLLSLFGAFP